MTLTNAPTLQTDRLILRGPERDDLPALTTMLTTSDRMSTLGGTVSATQARVAFLTNIGRWHHDGFGYFTLTRHDDPAPLGRVGLLSYPHDAVELAWHVFDGAEGHGFVVEAATAIRIWARNEGLAPLVSYIDPSNTRSRATASRLGANTNGTRTPHDPLCEIWDHPA
jgi:RimJ/RimL family protein N-acetyltransferase